MSGEIFRNVFSEDFGELGSGGLCSPSIASAALEGEASAEPPVGAAPAPRSGLVRQGVKRTGSRLHHPVVCGVIAWRPICHWADDRVLRVARQGAPRPPGITVPPRLPVLQSCCPNESPPANAANRFAYLKEITPRGSLPKRWATLEVPCRPSPSGVLCALRWRSCRWH